jgi:hypothetical protein
LRDVSTAVICWGQVVPEVESVALGIVGFTIPSKSRIQTDASHYFQHGRSVGVIERKSVEGCLPRDVETAYWDKNIG